MDIFTHYLTLSSISPSSLDMFWILLISKILKHRPPNHHLFQPSLRSLNLLSSRLWSSSSPRRTRKSCAALMVCCNSNSSLAPKKHSHFEADILMTWKRQRRNESKRSWYGWRWPRLVESLVRTLAPEKPGVHLLLWLQVVVSKVYVLLDATLLLFGDILW